MNIKPNDINKGPLESQEGVLYSTPLTLSEISTLPSATLQFFRNPKTWAHCIEASKAKVSICLDLNINL